MSELPKGWCNSDLYDVAEVVSGNAFKSKDFVENGIPVVKISNVQSGEYIEKNQEYLPESFDNKDNSRFIVTYNDLLIALTRPIVSNKLKVCTYPNKSQVGLLNQRVARLDVNEGFSKRFLHYYLSSKEFRESVQASMSETLQPNLSPKSLSKINIVCPPLAEQKRIVKKLDEVLAQVDTIKARLDGIPDLLKRFRQSVLASAVSGKLTEEWRTANPSFEWQTLTIGDVSTVATGKTPKRTNSEYWNSEDVPWLTSSATGNLYCYEAEQFVSHFGAEDCKLKRFPVGTLLLAMYGEGKTRGQVTELMFEATCNQACAAIVVDEAKALKSYVKLRLLENYEETRKAAAGGNQPNLNLNKVREIGIQLPSIEEQTEIIRLVDQYFAFADTIEAQVKKAQARVDNLTQSILAKAFRGELVPQDPNDEPADKLLERIAEARKEAEALAKAAKKAENAKKRAAKKAAENN